MNTLSLLEKLPMRELKYLESILNDGTYLSIVKAEDDPEIDKSKWTTNLNTYVKAAINSNGSLLTHYKNKLYGGRMYSFPSIQNVYGPIRGLLLRNSTTDLDMNNCHPVILRYIANKHKIPTPNLDHYISNRDIHYSCFSSRDEGKKKYLIAINSDIICSKKHSSHLLYMFDMEIKDVIKQIIGLRDYKDITDNIIFAKKQNKNGTTINHIMCYYENRIINSCFDYLISNNFKVSGFMYDGLLFDGNHYENTNLLTEITNHIDSIYPNLNMKWSYKKHDTSIRVPDDFIELETPIEPKIEDYYSIKKQFELTHSLIDSICCVMVQTDGFNRVIPRSIFRESYAQYYSFEQRVPITVMNPRGIAKECLIKKWFKDEKPRHYDSIDIYPNPALCPTNIFNNWIPFVMEKVSDYTHHQEGLDYILNHIKSLCNFDDAIYDYFIKWIGQMIQYPEVKTIMMTIISNEGTGKGQVLQLLKNMMGQGKVFETTDALNDVFGQFNAQLEPAFLVNINELKKADMKGCYEKLKGLITDGKVNINEKGLPKRQITSYHRFLITTNSEDPISTKQDDRRNLIIRASDINIGNKEYFSKLASYISNQDVVRTCYEYFKTIPNLDLFYKILVPKSEYQEALKELTKSPIVSWLESFVRDNWLNETITLTSKEAHTKYSEWYKSTYNFNNNVSLLQFGVRLTNIQVKGISKGPHLRSGATKVFDISLLKQSLNILNILEEDN